MYSFVFMGVHILALGYCYLASQNTPIFSCSLSANPEALILSGRNWGGQRAVKLFYSWEQFTQYAHHQRLKIAGYNFATQPTSLNVQKTSLSNGQVKITWQHPQQIGILFTPDRQSGDIFYKYIRYNELNSSAYGFSIPVLKKDN